jgi:hypothetical protein
MTTFRYTTPDGETRTFDSKRTVAFVALVEFPEGDRLPGWQLVKMSASEKGARSMGQSPLQTAWFRSMPHVVVPVEAADDAAVCEWFALCTNPATSVEPHPMGDVPICDRCADKLARIKGE